MYINNLNFNLYVLQLILYIPSMPMLETPTETELDCQQEHHQGIWIHDTIDTATSTSTSPRRRKKVSKNTIRKASHKKKQQQQQQHVERKNNRNKGYSLFHNALFLRVLCVTFLLVLSIVLIVRPNHNTTVKHKGGLQAENESMKIGNKNMEEKFLLATYHYKSQFNDKRTTWLSSIMELASELNRTLVLPSMNVHFPSTVRQNPPTYGTVGRSSNEWFQPFEDFFNTSIYDDNIHNDEAVNASHTERRLKVITLQEYRTTYGYDMDVHIIRHTKARELFNIKCPTEAFTKMVRFPSSVSSFSRNPTSDTESSLLSEFSRYGYNWTSHGMLCFPDDVRNTRYTTNTNTTATAAVVATSSSLEGKMQIEFEQLQKIEERHVLLDGFDNHNGDSRIRVPYRSLMSKGQLRQPRQHRREFPLVFRNELYQEAARFRKEYGLDTCSSLSSTQPISSNGNKNKNNNHDNRIKTTYDIRSDYHYRYVHESESHCDDNSNDENLVGGSSFAYISVVWRRFKWHMGGGKTFPPESVVNAVYELVETYYPQLSTVTNHQNYNITNKGAQINGNTNTIKSNQMYPLFLATDCKNEDELNYIREHVKPLFKVIQYKYSGDHENTVRMDERQLASNYTNKIGNHGQTTTASSSSSSTTTTTTTTTTSEFAMNPGYAALIDQILAAGAEVSATSPGSTFSNVVNQLRLEANRRPPIKLELV